MCPCVPVSESFRLQVDPVGSFGSSTSLRFSGVASARVAAKGLTDIAFTFNPITGMAAGEEIYLYLPGFGGKAKAGKATSQPPGYFSECIWNDTTSVLAFRAAIDISAGTNNLVGSVTVLARAETIGITLPANGVNARAAGDPLIGDESTPTYSTDAIEGPIDPTPVASVQGVGALEAAALKLSCAPFGCAGNTNVTITIASSSRLHPGDLVVLGSDSVLVPSSAGSIVPPVVSTSPNGVFLPAAAWRRAPLGECGWELVLTVAGSSLAGGVQVNSTIYPVRVPLGGVSSSVSKDLIFIRVESLFSPAAAVPVSILTPVPPVIENAVLYVSSEPEASWFGGSAVTLIVEVTANASLPVTLNPALVINLPGFGPNISFHTFSEPYGCSADKPTRGCKFSSVGCELPTDETESEVINDLGGFASVEWDSALQRLTLSRAVADLPAGKPFRAKLVAEFGLSLSLDGLNPVAGQGRVPLFAIVAGEREDNPRQFSEILIQSDPSMSTSSDIGEIPPLVTDAKISFKRQSTTALFMNIYITLKVSSKVPPASKLRFYLSGLKIPSQGLNLAAVQALPAAAAPAIQWDSALSSVIVELTASGKGLLPSEALLILIPAKLGISLPAYGLAGDGDQPSYEVMWASEPKFTNNFTMKTLSRRSLELVTSFGVFIELSATYEPRIPTLSTNLSFSLALSAPLAVGDTVMLQMQNFWLADANQSDLTEFIQVSNVS